MEKKKLYRKAIFLLTYRRTPGISYLLLKRKLHWRGWEFPKGGIEKKEKIKEAIIREVKEEVGQIPLRITKMPYSGRYKYDRAFPDRKGYSGQTFLLYAIEVKTHRVKIDEKEHERYAWVPFEKALKRLKWSNQRKSLRLVHQWLQRKK